MSMTRIEGGTILTMDQKNTILNEGCLWIEDDKIVEIKDLSARLPKESGHGMIDARGKIVLPGFINTHMHQRPMRGIADGQSLMVWHDVYIQAISNLMTTEDAYMGGLLGFGEALKSGVTTVMACSIYPEAEAKAAQDIGIRARFFAHIIFEEEAERYFKLLKAQGGTEEDRVRLWMGLEVASISPSRIRREARRLANELGLRIHTHFSEAQRQSVKDLIQDGFLGPDLHMAHCIQVTSEDIDQLAQYGVKVAHCPTSNLKFGLGIAPVLEMRSKGIAVGLGTDGLLSNGRIDLFEQMRIAALIQRMAWKNPKVLPVQDLLAMVTREAAQVMGMEKSVGSLEVGKKADITILRTDRLWLTPLVNQGQISNIMELIVWSATPTDVDTVLVDGNILVKNGELESQDEKEIRSKVNRIGERFLTEAIFKDLK